MQAFNELRKHALAKRDKAINLARADYAETLTRISALEQDLLGRELSTHKTISSCINRVLPSDRSFTTLDIMTALEALDPGKVWRKRAVDSHLSRLRERGVIQRVRRHRGQELTSYVRVGVEVEAGPFGDKTLPEVMAEVLGQQSMTPTELTVALKEAGYQSTMTMPSLRTHVSRTLHKEGRFERKGGKWLSDTP